MMHGRTSKALGTVETSNYCNQTKAPLNEALGTVETSNHSYQTKAPLKASPSKVNCTFLPNYRALYNCPPDPAASVIGHTPPPPPQPPHLCTLHTPSPRVPRIPHPMSPTRTH